MTRQELETQRDTLIHRLERGEAIIGEMQRKGQDYTEAENHWIDLLHQLETVYDQIYDIELNSIRQRLAS